MDGVTGERREAHMLNRSDDELGTIGTFVAAPAAA